jgi:iron-sulfur cluster assembly protein
MFRLTRAAAEQIKQAAEIQDDEPRLRVAAKIEEDGGLVYGMGFDEERENDLVLDCEGIQILISPRSQPLLSGTTLDFVELKPGEFQFIFDNPNEPGCSRPTDAGGCGSCGRGCGGG